MMYNIHINMPEINYYLYIYAVSRLPAGNAGALACNGGSSGVVWTRFFYVERSPRSISVLRRTLAGEGSCAPG